jgi:hypothetical protein
MQQIFTEYYCVPDTAQGSEDLAINKISKDFFLMKLTVGGIWSDNATQS